MKFYPIFLDLRGKTVLVVGGGEIGLQKVQGLLECEAAIRLVSPEVLEPVESLAHAGKLDWFKRGYETADLDGAVLVIAATNDPDLQTRIASEARSRGLWVNIVDVPPLCDFIAPAVVTRGEVQVAISTGGAAPALAKFLRQKLEPLLGPEVGQLVDVVRPLRADILKLPKPQRRALWDRIVTEDFLDKIRRDGAQSAERQIKEWMSNGTLPI